MSNTLHPTRQTNSSSIIQHDTRAINAILRRIDDLQARMDQGDQDADDLAQHIREELLPTLRSPAVREYALMRLNASRHPKVQCSRCGEFFPLHQFRHEHSFHCRHTTLEIDFTPRTGDPKESTKKAIAHKLALYEKAVMEREIAEASRLNRELLRLEGFVEAPWWAQHVVPRITRACAMIWESDHGEYDF